MDKETYKKAKDIMAKIERFNDYIERVEKTDEIYYRTPDMDGGFTPGKYCKFNEETGGDIKAAIKDYYQIKINQLYKQFDEL